MSPKFVSETLAALLRTHGRLNDTELLNANKFRSEAEPPEGMEFRLNH
jgi:hypothetical protein